MTRFQKLTAFAASAAALIMAAGSAQAATFATVSGTLVSVNDMKHVNTGPFAHGDTLTAGGKSLFSFTMGGGLPVNLAGVFHFLNAGSTTTATETTVGNDQFFSQGGYTGSFIDTYVGPTGTVDGVHLVKNVTVLLSGNFINGVVMGTNTIVPAKGIGGTFDADVTSYTSPYGPFAPGGFDFRMELTNASKDWGLDGPILRTTSLQGFGMFGSTVPEPASWSLMLLGVGALGATLRRRREVAAAA